MSGHGRAADAGGKRVPHAHQVRFVAAHGAHQPSVGASHPQGRSAELGHVDLDGRLAGGDGHPGGGALHPGRRVDAHVAGQHRGVTRRQLRTEGEPVAEGPRADGVDPHGERPGLDPGSGEGGALGEPGGGGVRDRGDVEHHRPCSDVAHRRREQAETVDLESFEVPGRRSVEIVVHGSTPISRARGRTDADRNLRRWWGRRTRWRSAWCFVSGPRRNRRCGRRRIGEACCLRSLGPPTWFRKYTNRPAARPSELELRRSAAGRRGQSGAPCRHQGDGRWGGRALRRVRRQSPR